MIEVKSMGDRGQQSIQQGTQQVDQPAEQPAEQRADQAAEQLLSDQSIKEPINEPADPLPDLQADRLLEMPPVLWSGLLLRLQSGLKSGLLLSQQVGHQWTTSLFKLRVHHRRTVPAWAFLSLTANGFLLLAGFMALIREVRLTMTPATLASTPTPPAAAVSRKTTAIAQGTRIFLNYQQWLDLLRQEAQVVAVKHPPNLTVLLGDSISQWFPQRLLLPDRTWLNQGISGETTAGLLQRLTLLDDTRPQTILVMVGINDLLRGVSDQEILSNYRNILLYLRAVHPHTQIVVQSILPHAHSNASWEGRDRLMQIPNSRIRALNHQLGAIASETSTAYFDLYPLFANAQGDLRMDLSTDGLHLNENGYLVWQTGLHLYLKGRG